MSGAVDNHRDMRELIIDMREPILDIKRTPDMGTNVRDDVIRIARNATDPDCHIHRYRAKDPELQS